MISLAEAQRRIVAGANHRTAVALTFDDGYFDNCRQALPLLLREGIPCTYFVSLRHVQTGEPFEHDLRRGRPLRPNTLEQIRELARAGVDIGCHTRTHADLGQIDDPEHLADEIGTAGAELAEAVAAPVRYFAFPYGQREHLSREAFRAASAAGYQGVCSAYGGYNFPGDDPFHVQRIAADPVMLRLKNWATIDPRKLDVPRYEYRGAAARDELEHHADRGEPVAEGAAR
jgi:peptidoglycan/xylan/chitin deacetylase (PgdA/CDA1 family)